MEQQSLYDMIRGGDEPLIWAIDISKTAGGRLAKAALASPACSKAVGGSFEAHVQIRMDNTTYHAWPAFRVSAVERSNGVVAVLYAHSYSDPESRRVLLFPAFLTPNAIVTKTRGGGVIVFDGAPSFADVVGLKKSVSVEKIQAILLLHEQSHLNFAAYDDRYCLMLSVLNSRRVAVACFPEAVDPATQEITAIPPAGDPGRNRAVVASAAKVEVTTCGHENCHGNSTRPVLRPVPPRRGDVQMMEVVNRVLWALE